MPHYLSINNMLLSTSQKVMSSTLNHQKNLIRLKRYQYILLMILQFLRLKKFYDHFIIVRNPLDRIISVYNNFFIANKISTSGLINVHKQFLNHSSINQELS